MDPSQSQLHDESWTSIEAGLREADALVRFGDHTRAFETYLQVAERYAESGRTLEAVAVGFRALALDAASFSSTRVASLLRELGGAAVPLCRRAIARLQDEQPDDAVLLAEVMLGLDPSDLPTRLELAELYARADKREEAVALLEATCRRLEDEGNERQWIATARVLLRIEPDHTPILRKLTHACLRLGQPAAALAAVARLVANDSEDLEALELLAEVYVELDRPTQALEAMQRLVDAMAVDAERAEAADRVLVRAHTWSASDDFHRGVARLRTQLRARFVEPSASPDGTGDADPLATVPDAPELL